MNKTYIGYKFELLNSNKTGITLSLHSVNNKNSNDHLLLSFDNENKIETLSTEEISIGANISQSEIFNRLVKHIQSTDQRTREIASEMISNFMEFDTENFDNQLLQLGVEMMIDQIIIEENINVEHKLVEGIFEFIWSKKLSFHVKSNYWKD